MIEIPYSEHGESGTWFNSAEGDPLPILVCPTCGCGLLGISTHIVLEDGSVKESVVCPPPCTFHEHVKLLDYQEKRDRIYRHTRNGVCEPLPKEETEEEKSHPIEQIPVRSTNIASMGYCGSRRWLEIVYAKGPKYRYYNVEEEVFEEALRAESVGGYVAKVVKRRYTYDRVS